MYAFIRFFCHLIHIGSLFLFRSERKVRDVKERARLKSGVLDEYTFPYPDPTREDFKPALPYPWRFQTRPTRPVKISNPPDPTRETKNLP